MLSKKSKKSKQDFNVDISKDVADLATLIYENPPSFDVSLSDVSPRDESWNDHRNNTTDVAQVYRSSKFYKYYERMQECSHYLEFGISQDTGLKLKRSYFCHVRNCPVCQWRRSLYYKAKAYKVFDAIQEQYPDYRWLFLTLTVQNCHISDLRSTLNHMGRAWHKLIRRKDFAHVAGFIRTTEVTRDSKRPYTHAHPHYHCILLVKPSYFKGKNYIKHMDWVRIWAACLNVTYLPNVDIRAVRDNMGRSNTLRSVIPETFKYAVKPSDMLHDKTPQAANWFIIYTEQVHKLRFVATGGLLKDTLKDGDVSDQDMIATGEDAQDTDADDKRLLHFTYRPVKRSYIYNPKFNT